MRITLLEIKGFGKFINRRIMPKEGFNLVFGKNESGKSTLMEFIRAMLYGERAGRRGKASAAAFEKSYRPWNSESYAGVMEYALDDGSAFRIDRNFSKGTVHILDGESRDISARFPLQRETGPRFAEAHLNVTADIFERSAMIRQMQCSIDEAGREALLEKLANLSATGSEEQSAAKALEALNAALLEKIGTDRSTKRPLDIVKADIAALDARRAEIIQLNEYWLDTWLRLKDEKEKLRRLTAELSMLTGERDERIARKLTAIKDECLALDGLIHKKRSECRKIEEKLSSSGKFAEVTENTVEALNACRYECREAEERLKRSNEEMETLRERERSLKEKLVRLEPLKEKADAPYREPYKPGEAACEASAGKEKAKGSWLMWFALIVCFVVAAAGAVIAVIDRDKGVWLPTGISVLSLFAGILLFAGRLRKNRKERAAEAEGFTGSLWQEGYIPVEACIDARRRISDLETLYDECRKELHEAAKRRSSAIEKRNEIAARISMLLDEPAAASWTLERIEAAADAFRAGYREYLEDDMKLGLAQRELKEMTERMNLLLREASALSKKDMGSTDDLIAATRGIAAEIKSVSDYSRQSWPDIEERINKVTEEINNTQIEIKGMETRLEDVPPLDELARLDGEKAMLLERKGCLESAGKSLMLAAEVLGRVARDMEKSFTPSLNREMSRLASRITDGRYTAVRGDPEIGLKLEVPESVELMPVNCLSGGTIDQIYFAMRLSSVALMENGRETIPLFLDEPFSQYDQERAKQALILLAEESRRRQVFLFTCSLREPDLARGILGEELNIIEL